MPLDNPFRPDEPYKWNELVYVHSRCYKGERPEICICPFALVTPKIWAHPKLPNGWALAPPASELASARYSSAAAARRAIHNPIRPGEVALQSLWTQHPAQIP